MCWKAPTLPGYEIMPISVHCLFVSYSGTKKQRCVSVFQLLLEFVFSFLLIQVFFHMNLALFRGEIFTKWSTGLFHPECMVNHSLASINIK